MIFYFSGTGNSEYVARRIAAATGDGVRSIAECVACRNLEFDVSKERRVGFVFPVHFWGLPAIVSEFLEELTVTAAERCFVYVVVTYGTSTGQAGWMARKALRNRGVTVGSCLSVRMVDTWTPLFNLTDKEKCRRREASAEAEIDAVVGRIVDCKAGNEERMRIPHVIAGVYHATYGSQRQTRHFHLMADRCAGCGLCASRCPSSAIAMRGGKPEWVKAQCTLCLRCLHHCPGFAIQYGKNTVRHGQYVNPNE